MHNVGLVDYMIASYLICVQLILVMLMYDVSDMFVSLYEFTQYVSGYGTSHIRCTSRLSFVLRVEVYDVLYKVKLKYVNLDYCLTMMIQDVLTCMWSCNEFFFVVHKVCWVKCEVCVL